MSFQIARAALSLFLLIAVAQARAATSTMSGFAVTRCDSNGQTCFKASANLAFVSMDGGAISAKSAALTVYQGEGKRQLINCSSFRFNLRSGFLICDNRGSADEKSYFVGSDLKIKETF